MALDPNFQNKGSKILLLESRLSYVYLNEPNITEDQNGNKVIKYKVCAAMQKDTFKKQKKYIHAAIKEAIAIGVKKGHIKEAMAANDMDTLIQMPSFNWPYYDADQKMKTGEHAMKPEFKNCICFNPWNKNPVPLVNKRKERIIDPDEIYSGMWGFVHLSFFAFGKGRLKSGISSYLNMVIKSRDDDPLDGTVTVDEAFGTLKFEDADEDAGMAGDLE